MGRGIRGGLGEEAAQILKLMANTTEIIFVYLKSQGRMPPPPPTPPRGYGPELYVSHTAFINLNKVL